MSSQATKGSDFTSKASLEFCEDVKKRLRLLSEERLSPREVKPCGFVPPFFLQKNGERRRKSSLHCAKHNFTQKTKFFLHIFTKLQRRLTCLSTVALCEGGWSRSISFRLWRGQLALPACHGVIKWSRMKFSPFLLRQGCGGQAGSKDCVSFYCATLTRRQAALYFQLAVLSPCVFCLTNWIMDDMLLAMFV